MTDTNEIPLDYEAFLEVYDEANKNAAERMKGEKPAKGTNTHETPEKGLSDENMSSDSDSDAPVPKDAEEALADEVKVAEQKAAETKEMNEAVGQEVNPNNGEVMTPPADSDKPKPRTRRKRSEN